MKYILSAAVIFLVFFALPLVMDAVINHRREPKGGRERFIFKSWDPRCWVGAHGAGDIGPSLSTDCRYCEVTCRSCGYGWLYRRTELLRLVYPCRNGARCACRSEETPVWGTRDGK